MTDLAERIEQNVLHRHLLKRNSALLLAVSGGLDSMGLLRAFHELSDRHGWKLSVAHFNHQLRGRSSDADESLVRKTAAGLKLPFIVARAEVRRFAEKSKLSIEMAARKLRHEFLARAAAERNISVVALAHHADDQVELFFLRTLRGAGGEGLAGMKWLAPSPANKEVTLIRPLLNVTRAELREFARENKIRFREDATNAQLDLPRNRVRHELLPLLRQHYQPGLTRTILRLMEIIGSEAEVVSDLARRWLEARGRDDAPGPPRMRPRGVAGFADLPSAVQRRILQSQLAGHGIPGDFELIERLRDSPNIFVSVGQNLSIARDNAGRLNLKSVSLRGFRIDELKVNLGSQAGKMEFAGTELSWNIADRKMRAGLGRKAGCEYFDADKVGGSVRLRHWRAGDRFQPIGMRCPAKLQDLFTNQKIGRGRRRELIVAEAGNGEIFWVEGLRMAERFKVTHGTRRCLVWRWRTVSG